MRIAIGGFLHESNSFAPRPTRYIDFVQPGGFPALIAGAGLFDAVRGASVPIAGAIEAAAGASLVPLAWGFANPAGPVQDEAFERIAALIFAGLSVALDKAPLDGVYLDLHGAAVAESFPDMEGELLRRVRAIVGDIPLTISLDPHCNLTRRMVDLCDAVVPFRTYPHVDMPAAGAQAMTLLLARIARGKPWARAFRQVDFFIPLPSQCTCFRRCSRCGDARADLAAVEGVAELAFCFGFPYADFADCGVAAGCLCGNPGAGRCRRSGLAGIIAAREATFRLEVIPAEEAVARAIATSATASRPVVIADTQDNPGGGGHGDTPGLLAELVRQNAQGALVALINDDASAAACHDAGEGPRSALDLGGKSNGVPLTVQAAVMKLTDGNFVGTGPMAKGNPADRRAERPDTGNARGAGDPRQPQDAGAGPGADPSCRHRAVIVQNLVLKSSVHFRADFQPIAETVIVAAAPGPGGGRSRLAAVQTSAPRIAAAADGQSGRCP